MNEFSRAVTRRFSSGKTLSQQWVEKGKVCQLRVKKGNRCEIRTSNNSGLIYAAVIGNVSMLITSIDSSIIFEDEGGSKGFACNASHGRSKEIQEI